MIFEILEDSTVSSESSYRFQVLLAVSRKGSFDNNIVSRRVATCKPGKPRLTIFSETLALFFVQFLSFRKMKAQDRQNGPSGLPEKNWLATRLVSIYFD